MNIAWRMGRRLAKVTLRKRSSYFFGCKCCPMFWQDAEGARSRESWFGGQKICQSYRRSSLLPASLQRWAEAVSFLHGVCVLNISTTSLLLGAYGFVATLTVSAIPCGCQGRPDAAIRAACLSLLLKAAQHLLKRSSLRLPSSHMLCLLCQKGRSPPRLP